MNSVRVHLPFVIAGCTFALLPLPEAHAQTAIEEIVVTATKREQRLQDVPFSINAQTQADIQRTGATSLEELSRNVAGLTIQNLGPGQSQVAVRGVSAGQIIRDQPGVKEQVGVYLDESVISLSLFTPDLDLYDLNRVETLRGPQGTLFGSGSVGGTIRYITNEPDAEQFASNIEANVNTINDGELGGHVKGMVNAPISDSAAIRIVGYDTEYGGYIDALRESGGESEDVNSGSRRGGRATLKWNAMDNLTVTPRIIYQEIEMDGFNRREVYNLYANPFTTTRPPISLGEREQYLLQREKFKDETLIADLNLNLSLEYVDLTSITSYIDRDLLVSRDASALTGSVSVDLGFPDAAVLIPSNLRDQTRLEQINQEFRVSSNTPGRLQWLIGVFYSDTERVYSQNLPTPGYDAFIDAAFGPGTAAAVSNNGFAPADQPYVSLLPYDIEQIAVFGEATYDLTERWHLTIGGRYYDFEETRRFQSGGLFSNGDDQVDTTSSDGFSPRFIMSYDVNDNLTLNAQASKGFRLGGVTDPLNATLCTPSDLAIFGGFQTYDDETLWNYEAGFKAQYGTVTLNAAAFYTDIKNLQATLDAGSCSSRVTFNVDEAHTAGAEVELRFQATPQFDISVAGSYVEAEFDSTVRDGTGAVIGGIEEGNRLASVPEFQIASTASYYFPVTAFNMDAQGYLSATIQHVGDRYTQPSDQVPGAGVFVSGLPFGGAPGTDPTIVDLKLDPYEILNLSAGLIHGTWEAVLYVNNVTDENADLSFDRERGGRARLGFRTNQPRTVGLTFRKSF